MLTTNPSTVHTSAGRPCTDIRLGEYRVCRMYPWMFDSCAVAMLEDFRMCPQLTRKQALELGKLLDTMDTKGWACKEFMFCISEDRAEILKEFISLPQVKMVDKFSNKAHGPSVMCVFRYSSAKDFQ